MPALAISAAGFAIPCGGASTEIVDVSMCSAAAAAACAVPAPVLLSPAGGQPVAPSNPQPCDQSAPASLFTYYFVTAPANASAASLAVALNPVAAANVAATTLGAFFNATLKSQQPGGSTTSVEFPALSCFWANLVYALQQTLSSTLLGPACIGGRRRALGGRRSLQPATYLGVSVANVGSLSLAGLPSASPAPTPTPASPAANVGAIVGGVLGGLAFVGLIAAGALLYRRRQLAAAREHSELMAKAALEKASAKLASAPGGGLRPGTMRHMSVRLVTPAASVDAGGDTATAASEALRRAASTRALVSYKSANFTSPLRASPAAAAAAAARSILAARSQVADATAPTVSASGSIVGVNPLGAEASVAARSARASIANMRTATAGSLVADGPPESPPPPPPLPDVEDSTVAKRAAAAAAAEKAALAASLASSALAAMRAPEPATPLPAIVAKADEDDDEPPPLPDWSDDGDGDHASTDSATTPPGAEEPSLAAVTADQESPPRVVEIPLIQPRRSVLARMPSILEAPNMRGPVASFMRQQSISVVRKFAPDGKVIEDGPPSAAAVAEVRTFPAGSPDAKLDAGSDSALAAPALTLSRGASHRATVSSPQGSPGGHSPHRAMGIFAKPPPLSPGRPPPAAPGTVPVPAGWTEHWSTRANAPYYKNLRTGVVSWAVPAGDSQPSPGAGAGQSAGIGAQPRASSRATLRLAQAAAKASTRSISANRY